MQEGERDDGRGCTEGADGDGAVTTISTGWNRARHRSRRWPRRAAVTHKAKPNAVAPGEGTVDGPGELPQPQPRHWGHRGGRRRDRQNPTDYGNAHHVDGSQHAREPAPEHSASTDRRSRSRWNRARGGRHCRPNKGSAAKPTMPPSDAAGTYHIDHCAGDEQHHHPHGHVSTLRMNPYVRCVLGDGVPQIKSISELLALTNYASPAEADTPCLRPRYGPFTQPETVVWGPRGCTLEADCSIDSAASGRASPSPKLTFTVDSVATPNTFATLRAGHRQLLIDRHLRTGESSGVAAGDLPGETEELDAMLPTSTTDAAAMATTSAPMEPLGQSLPKSDTQQSAHNARIVSPHSTFQARPGQHEEQAFPMSPLPATALVQRASSTSQQPQERRPRHRDTLMQPVAKLEESPYHYIMRNYIGGTFLYYSTVESKQYFLALCYQVIAQVRPILEQETLSPHQGMLPPINAPAFVLGDIHGNFEDLSFFLKRILIFHDFNLTPANLLCLGDYVDRGAFSLECVMLLFSLKIMNASKIVLLRGNHEDRVVCGDLRTYGHSCFLAQCQAVFGYAEGVKLFREVTSLFRYLPLGAELIIPGAPNASYLRTTTHPVHPNLYVSQVAVPIHPPSASAINGGRSSPRRNSSTTNLSGGGGASTSATPPRSMSLPDMTVHAVGLHGHPHAPPPGKGCHAPPAEAYNTFTDASATRGQPLRHQAHEERILCTHGGIPRFSGPPTSEGALDFLRTLNFPRMLTLFPNNPAAKDDPECAPDYFFTDLLVPLYASYPQLAPEGFTLDYRQHMRRQRPATTDGAPSGGARTADCSTTGSDLTESGAAGGVEEVAEAERAFRAKYVPELLGEEVRRAWYITFDLMWSDPTLTECEDGDGAMQVDEWGFGINTRGSNVVSFSAKAVDTFLSAYGYTMLFRAHQEKAHGLRWSKSNKVLTVFSSSNYLGHGNGAGCVVVAANGEIQLIEKMAQ